MFVKLNYGKYLLHTLLKSASLVALIVFVFSFLLNFLTSDLLTGLFLGFVVGIGAALITMYAVFIASSINCIVLANLIWFSKYRIKARTLHIIAHVVFMIVGIIALSTAWSKILSPSPLWDDVNTPSLFVLIPIIICMGSMLVVHWQTIKQLGIDDILRKRKEKA